MALVVWPVRSPTQASDLPFARAAVTKVPRRSCARTLPRFVPALWSSVLVTPAARRAARLPCYRRSESRRRHPPRRRRGSLAPSALRGARSRKRHRADWPSRRTRMHPDRRNRQRFTVATISAVIEWLRAETGTHASRPTTWRRRPRTTRRTSPTRRCTTPRPQPRQSLTRSSCFWIGQHSFERGLTTAQRLLNR